MQKLSEYIKSNQKAVLAITAIFIVLVSTYIYCLHKTAQNANSKANKIEMLSQKQVQDINELQNRLNISQNGAQALADTIRDGNQSKLQPITRITVQAPDVPAATKIITERIVEHDPTLPPAALAKSDKTIVVPQPDNKDYQVGVYKVNLKRNWYVGTGIGYQHGKPYIPISMQRNYDRSHAIAAQANLDSAGRVAGGQVIWSTGF